MFSFFRNTRATAAGETGAGRFEDYKASIHQHLLSNLDMAAVLVLGDQDAIAAAVTGAVDELIERSGFPLDAYEKHLLRKQVVDEVVGLGPLEPLLSDDKINDILVNGPNCIWVDRDGQLERTQIKFRDEQHLLHVINRVVASAGRRVDESSPIVDARLPDGSRVNAVIRPLSLDGPLLSIRRFGAVSLTLNDLVRLGTMDNRIASFLSSAVAARLNILVSGGTSAGKTTLLNVVSSAISDRERIITIEDTSELRLQQSHVLRLESRPANCEGKGLVPQRDLVKTALRMRPDRIIVGEVRGAEALDMLQAINTGHEGSLTTIHANSAKDALSRLETLVLMSGLDIAQRSVREQIASAFNLIVQVKRLSDGARRIVSVVEILGMDDAKIVVQPIYMFKQLSIGPDGRIKGKHIAVNKPRGIAEQFEDHGIELDESLFTAENRLEGLSYASTI